MSGHLSTAEDRDLELAAILDSASDAMFRLDEQGRITRCNPAAQRITGHREADLVGQPFESILESAAEQAFSNLAARPRVQGWHENLTVRLHRRDGQIVPAALAIAGPAATPDTRWVVLRDLSEREEAQHTLAESERRVRRSEALAGTGSFVVDAEAGLMQWSQGMYAIFGVDPVRFAPSVEGYLALVPPDERGRVADTIAAVLAGSAVDELDHRICRGDGSTGWVFLAIEPTSDRDGTIIGASGVCQDVTVRKEAEAAAQQALERERAAAQELRRLDQVKEDFLATVSHELRTPLTAILGFASLLRSTVPEHDQMLAPIERNGHDMHQMVERILDYSRLEAGRVAIQPRHLRLSEQVAAVLRQLQSSLSGRDVAILIPDELQVWADPTALERILVNLVSNAAKYCDPPGSIRIGAALGGIGVVVSVSDEGPGIDPKFQSQIFERFFRIPGATNAKRGSGVGLAIVAQYVELHGGQVWVDSTPGKGTTFHFDLPIERNPEREDDA